MKIPLSNTLRRLDRYCLLNHPLLWIMRLHWMVYIWLFGLGLTSLVALVAPVPIQAVTSLNAYFWTVLLLAGLTASPWIYLQARFAPQLRQNFQARTAAYLLAGYCTMTSLYLAWPYSFVTIIEAHISNKISKSQLQKDINEVETIESDFKEYRDQKTSPRNIERTRDNAESLSLPLSPKWQERVRSLENRWRYYQALNPTSYLPSTIGDADTIIRLSVRDLGNAIYWLNLLKGINSEHIYDTRSYANWRSFLTFELFILMLVLLLRSFQATDIRCILTVLLLGLLVWLALASFKVFRRAEDFGILFYALLLLFLLGSYAAIQAPRLKQKNILFAIGINIFTILLPWSLFILRFLANLSGYFFVWEKHSGSGTLNILFLLLGIPLLYALTPWIQNRYIIISSKPSKQATNPIFDL